MKMKKRMLTSLFLAGLMASNIVSASAANIKFNDVPENAWYASSVDYAVEKNLFSGTSATTFDPNGTMTRGMFVTVLSRQAQAKTDEAKSAEFTDVKDDSWYAKAIDWAFEKEYVNGTGDKTFSPDASITREQMASILSKYLTKAEAKIDTSVEATEDINHRYHAGYCRATQIDIDMKVGDSVTLNANDFPVPSGE